MNKMKLLLLAFLLQFMGAFGQYKITMHAFVIDQDSKKPIPYVNVGFINKGIGTVTNRTGRFYLQYDEDKINDKDLFKLSSNGYESLKLSQSQLLDKLKDNNKIFLKKLPFTNSKVLDPRDDEKMEKGSIGYTLYDPNLLAYWKDKEALGGEISTLIKVKKERTKLHNLKFNIVENTADSILVRVNIYNKKGKKPKENIVKGNIYHTIFRKKGEEIIDLSPYNIRIDSDFVVSLELVRVYGDDIQFAVSVGKGGRSFIKRISQDAWKEHKDAGIAFKLETSYPVSLNPLEALKKPEQIVLYWDTSLSMQARDLEKEFTFLKEYLSKIKHTTVDVVTFSDDLGKRKSFAVTNGDCTALIDMLTTLKYNGGSDFSKLFLETDKPDQYFVFTDGFATYGDHQFVYGTPVFYINSIEKADNASLQESSTASEGQYLDLSKISVDKALTRINYELEDTITYSNDLRKELVSGKVFSDTIPVQGCKVSVKGTLIETVTDAHGDFSIKADKNEVLTFQHFSMKNKEVTLTTSKEIVVQLGSKYEELKEVAVNQKKNRIPEEKVNLGNKKVDRSKLGYATYTRVSDDFPTAAQTLFDLIRGRFPGAQSILENGGATIRVRGSSSISLRNGVLWVVDGVVQSRMPDLTPPQIHSITLIPGIAGSIRYGTPARNGTFIIETKLAASLESANKLKDTLLIKGNDYNESNYLISSYLNKPEYLNKLTNSITYNEALETYYDLQKNHMYEVPFYVYSSEYFEIWDKDFSKQVISNLSEIAGTNYGALRTLAFILEEKGEIDKARVVYENIFDIRPNYAQSYLDLARIYKDTKEYQKAFDLYKTILQNQNNKIGFAEVRKQVESELRHLTNHYRSYLPKEEIPIEFLNVKGMPVRIVFDWNDPQAEFEFQFVNPQKKYEKWTHSFEKNKELLLEEVKHGITSKEFMVDESMSGEWIINVQSYGEVSQLNPTFMKYTIYRNYGLVNETKTVKLIKLYKQKDKVTLDKFSI
ncbi:carboxypeptidase-like regulatory domain-containing protein [Aquimarina pacifica]|uniref:carboxypeptidase-like regulatory domain-containing protein n=1 Tax=Aquimarina pacifica TaxID=1296415 RepID=UPI0004AFF479|nr:carboxypeptidase-like regulatory domain-containing protein [Aquimarina pacifica]